MEHEKKAEKMGVSILIFVVTELEYELTKVFPSTDSTNSLLMNNPLYRLSKALRSVIQSD